MKAILALLILGAVLTDLSRGKIYNILVFPAMAAGVLLRIAYGGVGEILPVLFSLVLPLILLIPFWFRKRSVAAGDIKLFSAVSVFMSIHEFLLCFALSFAAGGAMAMAVLLRTRNRNERIHFALPAGISVLLYLGGVY